MFIVYRFREELHYGKTVQDAVVRTVERAGHIICFSALTFGVALIALLFSPNFFLPSFAYAGLTVLVIGIACALLVLPAALTVLGPRIDFWTIGYRRSSGARGGSWHRIALFVMRRALPISVACVAIVLNFLSLSATFGILVWAFQDGNLSSLLSFTSTGTLEIRTMLLTFCLSFGLSMDYEVFILGRIKEEYERTGDTTLAVVTGLERSGSLVTAAALLLATVFAAFATSGIILLKLLGVGMTLAILLDATVIRALLLPTFMRLLGRFNWWAPPALKRMQRRIGLSEAEPDTMLEHNEVAPLL